MELIYGRVKKSWRKSSDGASLREEQACLDCPITQYRPETGVVMAGRCIHRLQWQRTLLCQSPVTFWRFSRLL